MTYALDPRDKPGLLLVMMKYFSSDQSYISFEGSLSHLTHLRTFEVAEELHECSVLKPIYNNSDFMLISLSETYVPDIWKALAAKDHLVREGIIHTQIAYQNTVVFGGYDNFHRECVYLYEDNVPELLQVLIDKHIIRGYEKII